MTSIYADTLLVTSFILTLLWSFTVVTVTLVIVRRRKLPHYYTPILGRTLLGRRVRHKLRPNLIPQPILVHLRPPVELVIEDDPTESEFLRPQIPAHLLESDQVAIHIEPDGSLSQEQQSIQRIIEHLKRSTEAKTRAAS
jgi:hypothetical protein